MRALVAPLLVACSLVSCATPPSIRHEPPKESVAEFSAPKGSDYTAELPFSAGTGYAWTASRFDEKIVKPAGQLSRRAHDDARVGGPMIEELRFNLVGRGETIIVFELKRPWEKDVSAIDTRSVKVTVN
jgi:predicted secreted protein